MVNLRSDLPANSEGNSSKAYDRTWSSISAICSAALGFGSTGNKIATYSNMEELFAVAHNKMKHRLTKHYHAAPAGDIDFASCHQCARYGR